MIKRYFPPVRETVLLVVITLAFLLLTATCIGLRTEHFLMMGLFLVLFFAGKTTRKLAVALLPFVVFAVSYDWMRVYPNYQVNPIDVQGLYEAEKSLFGISVNGDTLIPCEFFAMHHWPVADFFAGVFYLCWVPVPIAFGLWLYLKGDRQMYLRFAMVFLLVNLIGFAGYYIHPAAPPWYAMNYGFEAMQITRQRVRPAMDVNTTEICPTCFGKGTIKSSILFTDTLESKIDYLVNKLKIKKFSLHIHPYIAAYINQGLVSLKRKWQMKYGFGIKIIPSQKLAFLEYVFYDPQGEEIDMKEEFEIK